MNDEKNKNAKLTPTQVDRIWQHRLHNDIMFTNHNNFFLLCESILIAVISTISSNPQAKKPILLSVTILGFLLTVIWIYVQGKQRYILNLL